MIKKFRQYILEAEKSEFTEKHLPPTKHSYGAEWHDVRHTKKIGEHHSVNNIFSGVDGHYTHAFDINGTMEKDQTGLDPGKGMHVFSHVRDVASSFIKHYTPKSLTYSAFDDNFTHMYQKLGHHLAKKHGGEYNYDKETEHHHIFFGKHE